MHRQMTNATVTPLKQAYRQSDRDQRSDEFAELLGALADLAVQTRSHRLRLECLANGDARVAAAIEHLASLEGHAQEVAAEAARVHNELQHARLI